MKHFVLGIIPARGGSHGLKNKNIKKLKGMPLIHYSIKAAQESIMLDDYIVTTDSSAIRRVALKAGADVPFLRPKYLATANSPSYLAVQHAVEFYEKKHKQRVDSIILLQPIAPLRDHRDIDKALKIYLANINECDSLISVCDAQQYHPQTLYNRNELFLRPVIKKRKSYTTVRQKLEKTVWRNGAIYIVKREVVFKKRHMTGRHMIYYEMPRWKSVNIDDLYAFKMAEMILENKSRLQRAER